MRRPKENDKREVGETMNQLPFEPPPRETGGKSVINWVIWGFVSIAIIVIIYIVAPLVIGGKPGLPASAGPASVLTPSPAPSPTPPPPTPTPTPPPPTPTPTPMWAFTISPKAVGSFSTQSGYYYTTVTAHVVNQASDGNTHDLLASAFHLYPVINGSIRFDLLEVLVYPSSSADYSIAHNSSSDITLIFSTPLSRNHFDLHLDGARGGWSYGVTPP